MIAERTWKEDLSLRNGDKKNGIKFLFIYTFVYIFVPLLVFAYISFKGLRPQMVDDVKGFILTFILAALPLIPAAYLMGFYRSGNRAKMVMRMFSAVYLSGLILILSRFGRFNIILNEVYEKGRIIVSTANITVDATWLVVVSVIVLLCLGLISIIEYRENIKEYLSSTIESVNENDLD